MKYYQDNVLNKWSASFTDAKLEESFKSEHIQKVNCIQFPSMSTNLDLFCTKCYFHLKYQFNHCLLKMQNLKIIYLVCIELIISTSIHMISHSLYDFVRISKATGSAFCLVFLNFLPIKYIQFLFVSGLIFSTCVFMLEIKEEETNSYEMAYLSGITLVIIWMIDLYHFQGEAIAMIINMIIITYYSTLSYTFRNSYFMWILIIIIFKYFKNINERKLFLSLKNFQQWEKISEKIIPNLFILQSFDYRTHKMSVYDCNQKAKEYDIHKNQDKYIEFLSQFQLENVKMSSSSFYQSKKNQGLKTLKDYLLEKHAHVYNNFIQNKSNLFGKLNEIKNSKSQNQIEQNQTNKETLYQENIETISVSSNQFGKSKKTYFKVSIYNFMINEPCLIICLEDSSLVQKVQKLETNFLKREDYVNELISFVKQKLSSIIQLSESSTQYLKRQIIQTQIIIQAFLQKLRPVQTSSFMFSEVLEKIKSTYSNYDFQIEGILQNQQIQSDKGFIFITIMCFISALGIENIQLLQTNYIKDKLCEKITLNIQSRYLNQNLEDLNQISLLGLKSFSNLNSGCWQYLKNIMKQICLQDKPQIKLINDDSIMLQIEFMADITVLVQEKKEEQKSILNQICNEKTDLSYSNMVSFSKLPLNQYSSKYCQNKFVPNISFLNSKNKVTQSFMQKLDSSETKNQITINEIQIL